MDQIISIFEKLGADASFGPQFVTVVILFILAKFVLFNKLQFVIENREAKTTKMEEDAEKKFVKANELSESYRAKIDIAHGEAQKILNDKKNDVVGEENKKLKAAEAQTADYVEESREGILKNIEGKKKEIFNDVETLADSLVKKITK